MIRKPKSVALVVVFALTAVAATGASAATFHSEVEPTILTGTNAGEGHHTIQFPEGRLTCANATFTGTAAAKTQSTFSVRPTFSGCELFGEPATVTTTGCTYVFNATTNAGGHLPVSIECTGTSKIKVAAPGCTISFGSQATTGGVKATNFGSGSTRDQTVDATVTATFVKEGGSLCFLISGTTGTYTGNTTLKGYEEGSISKNLHEDGYVVTEKAQVGIWWE